MDGDGHGHGHGHGGHGHGHAHDCAAEHKEMAEAFDERWLFDTIDTANIRALNADPGYFVPADSCQIVGMTGALPEHGVLHAIKPFDLRFDTTRWLESDADEQLIITIPFTGSVKLKAFSLGSGPEGSGPCKIKAFINRDDIDFDNVNDMTPVQSWELAVGNPPDAEHLFKVSKFSRVRLLTLFVDTNHGDDTTRISYLAFKGIFTPLNTEPVVAAYELRPMPGDLRNKLEESAMNNLGM